MVGQKRKGKQGQDAWNAKRTKEDDAPKLILEKGKVYFFYRPKVDAHQVASAGDVQRLYMLMSPDDGKAAKPHSKAAAKASPGKNSAAAAASSPAKKQPQHQEDSNKSEASPQKSPTKSKSTPRSSRRNNSQVKEEEEEEEEEDDGAAAGGQDSKVKQEDSDIHQADQDSKAAASKPHASPAKSSGKKAVQTAPSKIVNETCKHHPQAQHRLLIVASKRLPAATNRAKVYAFVEAVSDDIVDLMHDKLDEYSYHTKTKGERHEQAARVAAEARYELIKQGNGAVHMLYALEVPGKATTVQHAFGIADEGSFVVQMRNPQASSSDADGRRVALASGDKAHFPESIQAHAFVGKRKPQLKFAPLVPEALDYVHCELLLIGVGWELHDEYGAAVDELEQDVIHDIEGLSEHQREHEMLKQLKTSPEKHPLAATQFK